MRTTLLGAAALAGLLALGACGNKGESSAESTEPAGAAATTDTGMASTGAPADASATGAMSGGPNATGAMNSTGAPGDTGAMNSTAGTGANSPGNTGSGTTTPSTPP